MRHLALYALRRSGRMDAQAQRNPMYERAAIGYAKLANRAADKAEIEPIERMTTIMRGRREEMRGRI